MHLLLPMGVGIAHSGAPALFIMDRRGFIDCPLVRCSPSAWRPSILVKRGEKEVTKVELTRIQVEHAAGKDPGIWCCDAVAACYLACEDRAIKCIESCLMTAGPTIGMLILQSAQATALQVVGASSDWQLSSSMCSKVLSYRVLYDTEWTMRTLFSVPISGRDGFCL